MGGLFAGNGAGCAPDRCDPTAEREIDTIVYDLFDLTPDEIALLEASLAGQY